MDLLNIFCFTKNKTTEKATTYKYSTKNKIWVFNNLIDSWTTHYQLEKKIAKFNFSYNYNNIYQLSFHNMISITFIITRYQRTSSIYKFPWYCSTGYRNRSDNYYFWRTYRCLVCWLPLHSRLYLLVRLCRRENFKVQCIN